ncbi:hypothetical protein TNIN_291421 [Trichonephila inaurata madagascariensis]|uniref:Uncharacterized protein n=1 Tax=Trichonephila inaurata madagascariensis TaxID=2747483 RepID=A0A8X6WNW2_9ARAC|nr:hypothetical protein TNIN_291421 [Trichonephila inaurata madagascariensis]
MFHSKSEDRSTLAEFARRIPELFEKRTCYIDNMKTEVFMGGTPGMRETTTIHSLPKTSEDPVLLLLDTPQNTPVGTPGSDIIISSGK